VAQALCAQQLAPAAAAAAAAAAALWLPRRLLLLSRPPWQPLAAAAPDNAWEDGACRRDFCIEHLLYATIFGQ